MPATGKHRRPKNRRVVRSLAITSAGGAALALPLIGATGAQAAESASSASYTVKPGDTLYKIANAQDVEGGWQELYQDNKGTIGGDPALILPGMKLSLDAEGATGAAASGSAQAPAATAAKAKVKAPASSSSKVSKASTSGYVAPVGASTSTAYKLAGGSWSSGYHTGVDFAVASGTPISSIAGGTVVSAGWAGSYGNEVVIKHADGRYSQYAHLSSISVSAGQGVGAGDRIGLSGSTGNSTGPHLHFEVRTGPGYGSDIDPVAYLRSHGVSV